MVITWYRDGQYVDSGYADGMKLVFFADTSVNPWGIHAMGNYDWHESADPQYWYYYFDGNERYPTTTGLSIKYISDVFIYSDDSPPSPPVAAFSATPRSGTAPLTVTFTDASTGTAPLTYAWDFQNDGSVDSTLKNPSYQYTAAGTYTVKLTVTNTAGSDPEVKAGYITVSAAPVAPVAAFSATPGQAQHHLLSRSLMHQPERHLSRMHGISRTTGVWTAPSRTRVISILQPEPTL